MEDSKVMTHATFSASLQVTSTGSVLAQMEDPSMELFSTMLRTHIPVTEQVCSVLRMDLTPCLEPSHQQSLFRQLLVKSIQSHSSMLALSAALNAKLLLS